MAIALSAIANLSREPATAEDVVAILRTGDGRPSHVRAVFQEVPAEAILRICARRGVAPRQLAAAARRAARLHLALNPDLSALLDETPA